MERWVGPGSDRALWEEVPAEVVIEWNQQLALPFEVTSEPPVD